MKFNWLDLLIALLFVWNFYSGWKKGFLVTLLKLIGFFAGAVLGIFIANYLSTHWHTHFAKALLYLISIVIGSTVCEFAGELLGKAIHKAIFFGALQILDNILGALLSMFKLIILFGLLIFLVNYFPNGTFKKYISQSYSYHELVKPTHQIANNLMSGVDKIDIKQ